jgi:hypothetical protein
MPKLFGMVLRRKNRLLDSMSEDLMHCEMWIALCWYGRWLPKNRILMLPGLKITTLLTHLWRINWLISKKTMKRVVQQHVKKNIKKKLLHQLRAQAINGSTLGLRVFLWEDAEVIAASLVETIFSFVGHSEKNSEYVFYVGATQDNQESYRYVREALASIMPRTKDRTPVITGHDGKELTVTQVLDDLHFEVVHL